MGRTKRTQPSQGGSKRQKAKKTTTGDTVDSVTAMELESVTDVATTAVESSCSQRSKYSMRSRRAEVNRDEADDSQGKASQPPLSPPTIMTSSPQSLLSTNTMESHSSSSIQRSSSPTTCQTALSTDSKESGRRRRKKTKAATDNNEQKEKPIINAVMIENANFESPANETCPVHQSLSPDSHLIADSEVGEVEDPEELKSEKTVTDGNNRYYTSEAMKPDDEIQIFAQDNSGIATKSSQESCNNVSNEENAEIVPITDSKEDTITDPEIADDPVMNVVDSVETVVGTVMEVADMRNLIIEDEKRGEAETAIENNNGSEDALIGEPVQLDTTCEVVIDDVLDTGEYIIDTKLDETLEPKKPSEVKDDIQMRATSPSFSPPLPETQPTADQPLVESSTADQFPESSSSQGEAGVKDTGSEMPTKDLAKTVAMMGSCVSYSPLVESMKGQLIMPTSDQDSPLVSTETVKDLHASTNFCMPRPTTKQVSMTSVDSQSLEVSGFFPKVEESAKSGNSGVPGTNVQVNPMMTEEQLDYMEEDRMDQQQPPILRQELTIQAALTMSQEPSKLDKVITGEPRIVNNSSDEVQTTGVVIEGITASIGMLRQSTPSHRGDDGIVSGDSKTSPARNSPTCLLHVRGLVRPYLVSQLMEMLRAQGVTFVEDEFWIDRIKSHCFVKYNCIEDAMRGRDAMHGLRWPGGSPKILDVDFATLEEFIACTADMASTATKNKNVSMLKGPLPSGQWSVKRLEEQNNTLPPLDQSKPQPVIQSSKPGSIDNRPVREWDLPKVAKAIRAMEQTRSHDHWEKKSCKVLDDLFRKTSATPCIYWLPLTAQQVNKKCLEMAEDAACKRNQQAGQRKTPVDDRKSRRQSRLTRSSEGRRRLATLSNERRKRFISPQKTRSSPAKRKRERSKSPRCV